MNIILHIFKKDTRHLRYLLALWLLLIFAESLLGLSRLTSASDGVAFGILLQVMSYVFPLLQMLVIYIIIPLLIQDEPLVGTTSYWFTRPIDRITLLKSKLFFVIACIILPALLVELVTFTANGVLLRDMLLAIPEIIIETANIILWATVFASICLHPGGLADHFYLHIPR